MANNAAGLDVSGALNPNWKGGLIAKICEFCAASYSVKQASSKSRYCSLACVGQARRGLRLVEPEKLKRAEKICEVCAVAYSVPTSHASRHHCCSKACSFVRRSGQSKGDKNPSWHGGLSRFPYPWNFRDISRAIIARDGGVCRNPICRRTDTRMTTHHINYDKQDCAPTNLICLCSACNSRANFDRAAWKLLYRMLIAADMYPLRFVAVQAKPKKEGGGWKVEEF